MKITNKNNLPSSIISALQNDPYDKGDCDISTTTLIKPIRVTALEKKHWDDLEVDASGMLRSLLGRAMHNILENADDEEGVIRELRLFETIDGITYSGQFDRFNTKTGHLEDYKTASVYSWKDGNVPEDYIKQLNIYKRLLENAGHTVSRLTTVCFFTDWKAGDAEHNKLYPPAEIHEFEVPIAKPEEVEAFIKRRIAAIKEAYAGNLPECTDEERWARPTKYAVMKPGAKKSMKNHEDREEAEKHAKRVGAKVELRPGSNRRCERYCPASKFCTQYQAILQQDKSE